MSSQSGPVRRWRRSTRLADRAWRPPGPRPVNRAASVTGGPHPSRTGWCSAEGRYASTAALKPSASFPQEDTISIAPPSRYRLRAGNTWSPDVLVLAGSQIIETDGPHHQQPAPLRGRPQSRPAVAALRGAGDPAGHRGLQDGDRSTPGCARNHATPSPRWLKQPLRAADPAARNA